MSLRQRSISTLAVLLLAGAAGCATQKVSMRSGPRAFTESDYERVYSAWTREAHPFAFGRLADVLDATATFESWEFRWAYVVRYAHDHALPTESRTALLRTTLEDASAHHRFFVTLIGTDWRESDLTSERSAWRVLLVDEAGRVTAPLEIERIERPTPAERIYFPSITPQRQTFRIVFPATHADGTATIAPDTRVIVLRFTGAQGTVDLRWELDTAEGA